MQPVAAFVEEDKFTPALNVAELVGVRVRRQINNGLANQSAALSGQHGNAPQSSQNDEVQ